jgi:peptidoglycan hydrolase-like amidase
MSKSFLVSIIFLTAFTTPASAQELPAEFTFRGSGYGHGVGMSQMGARSMALAGKSSTEILQYFYKDVLVEPLDDLKILRVNIGHLLSSTKISTKTPGAIVQLFSGDIGSQVDAVPIAVFSAGASLNLSILGSSVVPNVLIDKKSNAFAKNRSFTIRWSGTRYLEGVDALISVTQLGATRKYRYGQMVVKAVKDKTLGFRLELTNAVRLSDEYLWGVSEMPSFWPIAALQAQAVASRSYALSKAGIYRANCDCDLYGEISDQKFLGAIWKSVVTETAGLVVTQASLPIAAYYFSSSGGKTELSVNAWGSTRAFTQIVDDPGSLDITLNPRFVTWDRTLSQAVVARAFLLPDVVQLEILTRNESGTIGQIRATSSSGLQFTLRGETFRSRTKIPSAYCDLVGVQN